MFADKFKSKNKFEYMIESKLIGNGKWYYWISQQTEAANAWVQISSGAVGYEKIKTNSTGFGNFYGYGLSTNGGSSFIDAACPTAVSNWYWNAASVQWGSGIPTACGVSQDGYDLGSQGNGESNHNRFWAR